MRLTRRGLFVVRLGVVLAILLGIAAAIWAWESGQNSQCQWYQQHQPQQARYYSDP